MTTPVRPGIRAATAFDDGTIGFARQAGEVGIAFETAETRQRAKSGRLLTHRLYPYDGAPDRTRKATITLKWDSLPSVDIDFMNGLIAWGGPMTVAPWIVITESFWCLAGVAASGILSRLDAFTQIGPPPSDTDYFKARYGEAPDASDGFVTLGTPDTANSRTPWSVAALTPGSAERVWVAYAPLFVVQIGEDQVQFSQLTRQGYTLTLEEV